MKITSSVVLPIIIAILLSLVFEPLIKTINQKFKIPYGLAIAIIFIALFLVILILGTIIINSIKTILTLYPKYEERFLIIYKGIAQILNLSYNADYTLFENLWGQLGIRSFIQDIAVSLSSYLFSFSKNFIMIMLFSIFFLLELKILKEKIEIAFEKMQGRISKILTDIIEQVSRYVSVKFYASLFTALIVYFGTVVISLDFPIIWAFIAFIANFIPTFGSIFSGFITCIFTLIQFWPKPGPVIFVFILMVGVNMVIGNFIEPKIQGKNLGLSPFLIIISLSIWGWILGFGGMVLAVPLMVILKIICENVTLLHPMSILMGSTIPEKNNTEEIKD